MCCFSPLQKPEVGWLDDIIPAITRTEYNRGTKKSGNFQTFSTKCLVYPVVSVLYYRFRLIRTRRGFEV